MKCHICSKKINKAFLCQDCCREGVEHLKNNIDIIENPDWRYHCLICGEYKDRKIVDFPSGPICDKCIHEELENYNRK